MAIPLSYNLRNLVVRKTTTIMTSLGIALTVAVLIAVLALVEGLQTAFEVEGDSRNVLVMRKGGTAELNSVITPSSFETIKVKPGILRASDGHPLASLELVSGVSLATEANPDGFNITLRGVTAVGLELREYVKIGQGRWFRPGRREVVVGESIARNHPDVASLGKKLQFGKGEWEIVGVMDAGRGAIASEILGDLNQISGDLNRADALSSVLLRATAEVTATALVNSINDDRRLNATAITEREYLDSQTTSAAPIKFLGIFVSLIMAVGSSFAAMNTMYAAIARRAREVGTLRVLGFSRMSILTSFFLESVVLSAIGGLIGCLLVLPLNNLSTTLLSQVTFSELSFRFHTGPYALGTGMLFALLMGAIGGLLPARSAAKKEILVALKDT
jgi:putative ABC transport system permease protein